MIFFDEPSDESVHDHDVIEADILIAAPVDTVWALVNEPGWWINDGPLGDHDVDRDEDGIYHVTDPEAGTWLVEKTDEDPMDLVAYRWYPLAGDELPEEHATRVEISLSEENGQVALHIEESGLTSVSDDEAVAAQTWDDNSGMWEDVLLAAKRFCEGH